jgi:hypothetical protein
LFLAAHISVPIRLLGSASLLIVRRLSDLAMVAAAAEGMHSPARPRPRIADPGVIASRTVVKKSAHHKVRTGCLTCKYVIGALAVHIIRSTTNKLFCRARKVSTRRPPPEPEGLESKEWTLRSNAMKHSQRVTVVYPLAVHVMGMFPILPSRRSSQRLPRLDTTRLRLSVSRSSTTRRRQGPSSITWKEAPFSSPPIIHPHPTSGASLGRRQATRIRPSGIC